MVLNEWSIVFQKQFLMVVIFILGSLQTYCDVAVWKTIRKFCVYS